MSTILLTDDAMLAHDNGPGHPERPDRLRAIRTILERAALPHVRWATPRPASQEQLGRVHDAIHVAHVLAARGRHHAFDMETMASPGSVDAALLSAGAAIEAAAVVASGEARSAFALVRPPGHHAEPDCAMGFCLLNNIAIAAAHAIAELGRQRVLIVDWDVHHGNGTQAAFFGRADVLLFSVHQSMLFPDTGSAEEVGDGPGRGFTVNAPLPAGRTDGDYELVFDRLLMPIAEAYRPDLVLVSAGFDAHLADPLAGMRVTETGFVSMLQRVRKIAAAHAGGGVALILEGGYDLQSLADSVAAVVTALGEEPTEPESVNRRDGFDIEPLVRAYQPFWPSLEAGG
jgi:acetoin utilization deacetylase AcuC-like enzyme